MTPSLGRGGEPSGLVLRTRGRSHPWHATPACCGFPVCQGSQPQGWVTRQDLFLDREQELFPLKETFLHTSLGSS